MDVSCKSLIDLLNHQFQNYVKQAVLYIFSSAVSFIKVKGYYIWNSEMCRVLPKYNLQSSEDVFIDICNVVVFLLFYRTVFEGGNQDNWFT